MSAKRGELMERLRNLSPSPANWLEAHTRNRAIAYHHAAKKIGIEVFIKKWSEERYIVWRVK